MGVVSEEFRDGVYSLTLNRPEKKNAMSLELLEALFRSLARAEKEGASIIVIRGAGNTFCAGGDVTEFRDSPAPAVQVDAMADYLNRGIMLIRTIPAITIAVVEGLAVGAGLSLTLACDLTLAESNAVMNMGYRRIGLTPDGGGSVFLPRLVGMKKFNELYFMSRNIAMDEAKAFGLINFTADAKDLEKELAGLVDGLKAMPMETTRSLKELVNKSVLSGLSTHLDKERLYVSRFSAKPAFQERLKKTFKKG